MSGQRYAVALALAVVAWSAIAMFGCTRSRSPDPATREGSPVAASGTPVAADGATTAVQQAPPDAQPSTNAREEAARFRAEQAGTYDGARSPASDLNAQIGGSAGRATNPERSLVVLKSHRAVDPAVDDSKVALSFIRTGKASVKACYEKLRARERTATGMLTLRFAITTTGKVADATADSWNQELSACVLAAMQDWTFSAPGRQTTFELVLSLVIG